MDDEGGKEFKEGEILYFHEIFFIIILQSSHKQKRRRQDFKHVSEIKQTFFLMMMRENSLFCRIQVRKS